MLHSIAVDKDIASSIDKVNRDIESTTASLSDTFLIPLASSINCLSILTERDDLVSSEPSILMKSDLIHSKSLICLFPVIGILEETAGNSIPANYGEDMEGKNVRIKMHNVNISFVVNQKMNLQSMNEDSN